MEYRIENAKPDPPKVAVITLSIGELAILSYAVRYAFGPSDVIDPQWRSVRDAIVKIEDEIQP